MKFTLSWLKDHLDTSASLAQLRQKLDQIGLEVEGIDDPSEKLGRFTIARVLEAKRHPQADRLQVLQVEIEPGKTLVLRLLTVGEPHADGTRTVFFELNGQPRSVSITDRSLEAKVQKRPKATPGDAREVAAPMPGLIVTVAVRTGDKVKKGQKLLSLEAMKMETTLYAERDGTLAEVLVAPGTPVEAGELIARYADA